MQSTSITWVVEIRVIPIVLRKVLFERNPPRKFLKYKADVDMAVENKSQIALIGLRNRPIEKISTSFGLL